MGVEAVRRAAPGTRVEQRTLGQDDLEEVVEAVVEQDARVEGHDHVDAEEELEQAFVNVEVDRARRLRIGAGPVEHGDVALALDREHHLERAVAEAVVVDLVREGRPAPRGCTSDDQHSSPRACARVSASQASANVSPPKRSQISRTRVSAARQPRDQRHQVGAVHVRRARVVEDDLERRSFRSPLLDRS